MSKVAVAPGVVFAEVDGDTVLLDGRSGVYYALNDVGTRCWALICEGRLLGDIHKTVRREYEVPPEVLWADLTKLVDEMTKNSLVTVEPSG
jgi:hypothetical protein